MVSTDDPFRDTSGGKAQTFLENAPLTEAEKSAIGSADWERLMEQLAPRSR